MKDWIHELTREQERLIIRVLKYIEENQPEEIEEHTITVLNRILENKKYSELDANLLNVLIEWFRNVSKN